MKRAAQRERDAELIERFRNGERQFQLAVAYGLSAAAISLILIRNLGPAEVARISGVHREEASYQRRTTPKPPTLSVWGHRDVALMVAAARRGFGLPLIAKAGGVSPAEADLVLWAKLGRTIPETCDFINAKRGEAA